MKKKNERKLVKTYYLPFGKVNNSLGKSLKYTWLIASEADILFFGTHWKTTTKLESLVKRSINKKGNAKIKEFSTRPHLTPQEQPQKVMIYPHVSGSNTNQKPTFCFTEHNLPTHNLGNLQFFKRCSVNAVLTWFSIFRYGRSYLHHFCGQRFSSSNKQQPEDIS